MNIYVQNACIKSQYTNKCVVAVIIQSSYSCSLTVGISSKLSNTMINGAGILQWVGDDMSEMTKMTRFTHLFVLSSMKGPTNNPSNY